jgi:hypothetical protein
MNKNLEKRRSFKKRSNHPPTFQVVLEEGWMNSVHDYQTFMDAFPNGNYTLLVAVDPG